MTLQHDGIDLEDVWQAIEVCYEVWDAERVAFSENNGDTRIEL